MTTSTLPDRPDAVTGDLESGNDQLRLGRTPGGRLYVEGVRSNGSAYRLTRDTRKPQADAAMAYLEAQRAYVAEQVAGMKAALATLTAAGINPGAMPSSNAEAEDAAVAQPGGEAQEPTEPEGAQAPQRAERPKPPSKREAKYGAAVVERSALVRKIDGYKAPASLKQHLAVDKAVRRLLDGEPTAEGILSLIEGVESREALLPYAQSAAGSTKPLKRLMGEIPKEDDLRPRHIAASLWAWLGQLSETA